MIVRGRKHDVLSSPDALARWWEEADKQYPGSRVIVGGEGALIAWTSELFAAVKALRMALRTLSTHVVERQVVEEEDLQPINEILALGYSALQRTGQGTARAVMRLRDPEKGWVLVPIALSALQLFTESDWQRLHKCKNDRCSLFFYDTTKSGTRHWCSLGCMNRARATHRRQLTRKAVSLQ
jgi:predicted RNA-binding Zn ribbon-like protein